MGRYPLRTVHSWVVRSTRAAVTWGPHTPLGGLHKLNMLLSTRQTLCSDLSIGYVKLKRSERTETEEDEVPNPLTVFAADALYRMGLTMTMTMTRLA